MRISFVCILQRPPPPHIRPSRTRIDNRSPSVSRALSYSRCRCSCERGPSEPGFFLCLYLSLSSPRGLEGFDSEPEAVPPERVARENPMQRDERCGTIRSLSLSLYPPVNTSLRGSAYFTWLAPRVAFPAAAAASSHYIRRCAVGMVFSSRNKGRRPPKRSPLLVRIRAERIRRPDGCLWDSHWGQTWVATPGGKGVPCPVLCLAAPGAHRCWALLSRAM